MERSWVVVVRDRINAEKSIYPWIVRIDLPGAACQVPALLVASLAHRTFQLGPEIVRLQEQRVGQSRQPLWMIWLSLEDLAIECLLTAQQIERLRPEAERARAGGGPLPPGSQLATRFPEPPV